jgi:hypothetical protein
MEGALPTRLDSGVTWTDLVDRTVPRVVRASWEAHLFHPGDRVALANPRSDDAGAAGRELLELGQLHGIRNFLVTRTLVSVNPCDGMSSIRASYGLAECEGLWPHELFVDPRPLTRILGAIITLGPATWLVPIEAGSAARRDRSQDPVLLSASLERRVRHALGRARARDLDGLLGEFLVASNPRRPAPLVAAYWTSPLGADEDELLRASLAAEKPRGAGPGAGRGLGAGATFSLRRA